MKYKYTAHYSLLLVIIAHAVALAAVVYAPEQPNPIVIEAPTIQGIIIASEPITKPPEPTPPPPEQKPALKPAIPLPKAPASDRAIKQESPPEPTPPPAVVTPVKTAEPAQALITPPQADASQFNNPAPVYPSQSRRLHEQGTVVLEVLVKADGSLGDLRLKTSSGYSRLDAAALRAVKNWHFVPAKRGDTAIDFWYELPIEFSLNN